MTRSSGQTFPEDGWQAPAGARQARLNFGSIANAHNHKWMLTPKGIAFVYVRPEVQHLIEPLIGGHGWVPDRRSEQPLIDYVEQYGTRDFAGFLAGPATLESMAAQDWGKCRNALIISGLSLSN